MEMATWTFEILHVPTGHTFSAGKYFFNVESEDLGDLMFRARARFIDCQDEEKFFMFNTDSGYSAIPPNILQDCTFTSWFCDENRKPLEYDH